MILRNLEIVGDVGFYDIFINNENITKVTPLGNANTGVDEQQLLFHNAMAFPGLINSHDHLDFNNFPQLGNKIYSNYTEWADHIHKNHKAEINEVLKIPELQRIQSGIYKNLFAGVTTVVNHGKYLPVKNTLVKILQPGRSLHSVQFEEKWKWKINSPFARNPIVVHIGEGTDKAALEEIGELIRWNIFNREIIGVHAVAMKEKQSAYFKGLVWCPSSNYFLFNKTAPMHLLKKQTTILFGTDSTLTADWNIWDHIRLARSTKMLSDEELIDSLTGNPADIWQLQGYGKIKKNYTADIIIADKRMSSLPEAFFSVDPEDILMVINDGKIKLFDERLLSQLLNNRLNIKEFSKKSIDGITKYVETN
jgi:cytosine/adenosine deaminase-related metal-dependent hydrolase